MSARCVVAVAVVGVLSTWSVHAHAGVRVVFRVGQQTLKLSADENTPFFGDEIALAVDGYNTAAAVYDAKRGTTTAKLAASDLGMSDKLLTLSPGLELGNNWIFMRVEGIAGYGQTVHTLGVGIYPINLQAPIAPATKLYVSFGATAASLTRVDTDQQGALVSVRCAAGIRFAKHLMVEVGYNPWVLGGVVDLSAIREMATAYDVDAPPPQPKGSIAAGEQRGAFDVSAGISF